MTCSVRMLVLFLTAATASVSFGDVVPLPRAHSHNDYTREVPLRTALSRGVCSVEADVFRVKDDLLVAHDFKDVTPDRTLRGLYLEPLAQIARENGGYIFAPDVPFTLLIDFKSAGKFTWPVLKKQLDDYKDVLTEFTDDKTERRAITVVISGSRPIEEVAGEPVRYAGIDGRVADMAEQTNANLYPMISASWGRHFKWTSRGDFPEEEREKLDKIVAAAHANGQVLRFWAIPARENAWDVLYEAGVDLINADDLKAVQAFLLEKRGIK